MDEQQKIIAILMTFVIHYFEYDYKNETLKDICAMLDKKISIEQFEKKWMLNPASDQQQ